MLELNVNKELLEWVQHAVLSSSVVAVCYSHYVRKELTKEEMLVSMVVGLYRENLQLQQDFLDGCSLRGDARRDYAPCGVEVVKNENKV